MIKIIVINSCDNCPHSSVGKITKGKGGIFSCDITKKVIGYHIDIINFKFPDWCTLTEMK